jgi:4a-hydroxytetrahydrobiopterin dehydratase
MPAKLKSLKLFRPFGRRIVQQTPSGDGMKPANSKASDLISRHCAPCGKGTGALSAGQVQLLLADLKGWESTGKEISRSFKFQNYYETMAFVNAIAFVSHREDHHPDLEVGYNRCVVKYSTHSAGGLSENDFICAAKVDALTA